MLIKSLEQMEQIVKKNKSLIWDGWTVVELQPAKNALMSKDGIRVKGRWYIQKRFDATAAGWDIPDNIVG